MCSRNICEFSDVQREFYPIGGMMKWLVLRLSRTEIEAVFLCSTLEMVSTMTKSFSWLWQMSNENFISVILNLWILGGSSSKLFKDCFLGRNVAYQDCGLRHPAGLVPVESHSLCSEDLWSVLFSPRSKEQTFLSGSPFQESDVRHPYTRASHVSDKLRFL